MNWYLDAFKNYANFQGRARRKAYWMFVLFWLIAAGIASVLDSTLGTNGVIFGLYALGTLLPFLALAVRRLHDIGKSGWWYLIQLVPVIGGIWFLVLTVTDSQPGTNQYGPNPKGA
jgi:uncharacterized membrane protein YhaH (DUF805 family)